MAIKTWDDFINLLADRITDSGGELPTYYLEMKATFAERDAARATEHNDTLVDYLAVSAAALDPNPTTHKKAWNGEGLPPVGTVCEFVRLDNCQKETLQSGAHVTVIAHYKGFNGNGVAAFTYDYLFGREVESAVAACFRPIRTAEQLAAEEREKGIDRMCKVVMAHPAYQAHNVNLDCSAAMRLAIEALYDADA